MKCLLCNTKLTQATASTTAIYVMDTSIYPINLCKKHDQEELATFIKEKLDIK